MASTADEVVDEDVRREQKAELRREEKADEVRVERAGHAGEEAAEREGQQFVVGDVDAERLCEVIGQADALPDEPETASLQLSENDEHNEHQGEPQVVLTGFRDQRHAQDARLRNTAQAGIATGQRDPDRGDETDRLDEGHRHHGEVDAPQPQRWIADAEADGGGQGGPAQQRELERKAEIFGEER